MSDRTADVSLRLLAPRLTALGTGDGNALQNVNTTPLPNCAMCFVQDSGTLYRLDKLSTLTPALPTDLGIIIPASGPGRWLALSGFALGEALSYQIAMDQASSTVDTSDNNWAAFDAGTKWTVADGVITNTGLIVDTSFWSSATPGAGILTYSGPTAFLLFSADVTAEGGNQDTLFGVYITKNGGFIGGTDVLVREQQSGLAANVTGPMQIHTESRLIAQSGDTFQIILIDHASPGVDAVVLRASLAVTLA